MLKLLKNFIVIKERCSLKIVGIGNLVVDCYYLNNKFLGIDGGNTTSNIIANLSNLGIKTKIIGLCGNDLLGEIAINSLKKYNVDVENVIKKEINTKIFHIKIYNNGDSFSSKTISHCPYCKKKNRYVKTKADVNYILTSINQNDILVIDSIVKNLPIITRVNNKIFLDLGYSNEFLYINDTKIIENLSKNFEIINMNERVEKFLLNKLKLKNNLEIFKLTKSKLLIITRGSGGVDFIFDNKIIMKKISENKKGDEIDTNGAGDAFFAIVISKYLKNNYVINEEMLELTFKEAINVTKELVTKIGARSHIGDLYKIDEKYICNCK